MKWMEALQAAHAAKREGDPATAEMYFEHAIYEAQRAQGPINSDLADCLTSFAEFLESESRFADAMFRFKLAETIHKAMGNDVAANYVGTQAAAMQAAERQSIA